jgi:hypothetical protein
MILCCPVDLEDGEHFIRAESGRAAWKLTQSTEDFGSKDSAIEVEDVGSHGSLDNNEGVGVVDEQPEVDVVDEQPGMGVVDEHEVGGSNEKESSQGEGGDIATDLEGREEHEASTEDDVTGVEDDVTGVENDGAGVEDDMKGASTEGELGQEEGGNGEGTGKTRDGDAEVQDEPHGGTGGTDEPHDVDSIAAAPDSEEIEARGDVHTSETGDPPLYGTEEDDHQD